MILNEKVRRFLRNKRRGMEYTLENLSDEQISVATISNIETGREDVSKSKIKHYCEKIGLDFEEVPQIIKDEEEREDILRKKITRVESLLDLIGAKKASEKLDEISIYSDDPMSVFYHYVEGKCLYHKKSWKRSEKCFRKAMQTLDKHPKLENSNIRSASYHELARIAFFSGDLEQAVEYTNDGLHAFVQDGERAEINHKLLVSKVLYLDNLNRDGEAMQTLLQLWQEENRIESIEVVLLMYELRSRLLSKQKHYEQAIYFAERGINIARENKKIERAFELYTVLGTLHVNQGKFDEAEENYLCALELEKFIKKTHLLVSTYTKLGVLYNQMKKWEQAEFMINRGLKLGDKSNDFLRNIEALEAKGDFYLKQKLYSQAIEPFENALEQAEKYGFSKQTENNLVKLVHCSEFVDMKLYKKYVEKLIKVEVQSKIGSISGGEGE